MLEHGHFGDQICRFDQLRFGIATSETDMGHRWLLCQQEFNDLVDVKIVIAQGNVDFVKKHELYFGVQDLLFGNVLAVQGDLHITLAVLRFPGKSFT